MTQIKANTMATAICIEWFELLFKPYKVGKGQFDMNAAYRTKVAEIDLNSIKSQAVRESLNQIRKGVDNYKRAMKSEKGLQDSEFEELKEFASYKMETLTTLAMAFIPLDEEGCTFLTNELLKAVEKLGKKRLKQNGKHRNSSS